MAVFSVSDKLYLDELMPGFTLDDVKNNTEADFIINF
jgi:acyl CoA:acetate/3-ketoacid CoA transferase beta subunit